MLYDIPFCKLRMKSMHPFKSYWREAISLPCILPQQQKLNQKRAKLGQNFADITNIEPDLYYILLQTFNKINAFLQKLLSGNQYQQTNKN